MNDFKKCTIRPSQVDKDAEIKRVNLRITEIARTIAAILIAGKCPAYLHKEYPAFSRPTLDFSPSQ